MTVYEYYTEKSNTIIANSSRYTGNTFTVGTVGDNVAFNLTDITIRVYQLVVEPPGTINVVVYGVDGNGFPTGTAISTGSFNGDTVTTNTDGENVSVSMTSVRLSKSTKYAFVIGGSSTGNIYIKCQRDGTYLGGEHISSDDAGGSWSAPSTIDLYFVTEGTVVSCASWTTESDCTENGCYWYDDSCHSDPFFAHETFRSGYLRRFQNRQIFGHYSASGGGDLRGVAVNQSGHVLTDVEIDVSSGIHVVQESGAFVQISGQHVYVESGIWVAGLSFSGLDIEVSVSGDPVNISGGHVYVESGVYLASGLAVTVESGLGVAISGQHVYVESGVYLASGLNTIIESGIYVASGLAVIAESGLGVLISGQHVYVESGVYVASGIYDGIATIIKTDAIRTITAASGGEVLHSGPILSMTVKALSENTSDMYIGGASPYRPYSGFGFQLGGGESKSYDIYNFDVCYLCATTSGDKVTFDGINA